jgi:flagellar motor switch protein FliG
LDYALQPTGRPPPDLRIRRASMSDSEDVDGPKVAAAILNKMQSSKKERLIQSIKASDPQIGARIEEKLYDFDKLLELTPQSLQLLLQSIPDHDLILALKTAGDAVTKTVYHNLSDRKAEYIKNEFENAPPVRISEVHNAQRRILAKLDELRETGGIKTLGSNDIWV